jgi:hypothetical protein
MSGHCQHRADTTEKVLFWSDTRGFFPYAERMETPITPIIRKLNASDSKHRYAALNVSRSNMHVSEPMPKLFGSLALIKKVPGVKFGGVVAMLGWCEGDSLSVANNFDKDFLALIDTIRSVVGKKNFPVILSQNEKNAIRNTQPHYEPYYTYSDIVTTKIAKLPLTDRRIKLCPKEPMAREYYCNGHHYNKQGYDIFSSEAARLLK